jgi:hypothetical protein
MRQVNRKIKDSPEYSVKLAELHVEVWWGILLLVIGAIYTVKYRSSKRVTLAFVVL